MTRVRRWLDDVLWGPETASRLVVVHVGLAALIGLRIVLGSYRQLAGTPSALVDPVPILGWLDRMPSAEVIVAIQVVGGVAALAAVLAVLGRYLPRSAPSAPGRSGFDAVPRAARARGLAVARPLRGPHLAFAVAWLCYLVLAGLRGSRGKVLHNDLLLLWASAPFLLAPVAVDVRDRVARRGYGWPIRVAMVITALVYFFAGYHKLRRSGIDWVLGDNMRYLLLWGPSIGEAQWESLARWVGEHLWAAKASGAFILGLEITFPVVLVVRRVQVWYALAAVFLHVTTWFVLGLDYWAWAATVLLLFIDWPAVTHRVRRLSRRDLDARDASAVPVGGA
jgi:hypothetical protein